ncbi:MAG: hypothetical protein IKT40_12160 [Bacilli bacterium]|nr:hypothetical protein [Bacilli bacterium]
MRIIINEAQEKLLKEHILNEAIGFGFSFGYLKTLNSFKKRLDYCKEYLGDPIGRGSSRICFQLDDDKILKFAYNNKGIAQNQEEFNFSQENFVDITPKVFPELSDTENFMFIVSEYVLPAKDNDFEVVCGVDFITFTHIIKTVESWYNTRNGRKYLSDEDMEELCNSSDDIREFVDYVSNYQPIIGDMLNIRNYGMVSRNGQASIVLLDSGLSQEIWNEYYAKNRR